MELLRRINATEEDKFEEWFNEYKRLGGTDDLKTFGINLNIFFELTLNLFVYGDMRKFDGTIWESRNEAWKCWGEYIGSPFEANIYFDAVNNITAYT